jgi:hypothetical protein
MHHAFYGGIRREGPMSDRHERSNQHHEQRHEGHEHHGLVEVTLLLEDEHLDALDEVAAEISKELKQPWDRGAVVRLALSEFFSRRGKIT